MQEDFVPNLHLCYYTVISLQDVFLVATKLFEEGKIFVSDNIHEPLSVTLIAQKKTSPVFWSVPYSHHLQKGKEYDKQEQFSISGQEFASNKNQK